MTLGEELEEIMNLKDEKEKIKRLCEINLMLIDMLQKMINVTMAQMGIPEDFGKE